MVEKKSRLGENQYICAKVSQEVDRNSPYCVLWIIFFIYTATGAFFIQFVLLPYVFPDFSVVFRMLYLFLVNPRSIPELRK